MFKLKSILLTLILAIETSRSIWKVLSFIRASSSAANHRPLLLWVEETLVHLNRARGGAEESTQHFFFES